MVATATLGTTLHTAVAGTANFDEIWIWAYNHSAAAVDLTIEFGGATSPGLIVQGSVASKSGAFLIIPGWRLQNSLVITAFASVASVVSCMINVNRYTA